MEMDRCATNSEKIRQLEIRADKVDTILDKMQNRLPNWAVVAMSLLTALIGWLLSSLRG
jgi:hypothetical protein